MFYDEIYGKINVVEVLDMAKTMLKCSSSFIDPETDQKHYGYFLWQTRRKISEVMDSVETSIFQITYDALVDRNAYMLYAKNNVGGYNLEPHELNMKREEAIKEAVERFKDIPIQGYERYAIIKYTINLEINNLCISTLRNYVASTGKVSTFLWYDFNKRRDDLMFPIITW